MTGQKATIGVAPARDQGPDTDSTLSIATSLDGREEAGNNRWPVSLQDLLHELLGAKQGDQALATENFNVDAKPWQTCNAAQKRSKLGWLARTFKCIWAYCYLLRWWLFQIGVATLCIRTMTGGAPSNFKMTSLINISRVTPYLDPPAISVIFRRKHNRQGPKCSEGRLEDLMTSAFELGGSGACSPTFTAHLNSMPETRPWWTLMTSTPQSIGSESWRSYTAHVERTPHEDHPPTCDSISSPNLDEPLAIPPEKDLGEAVMEDSCSVLTSCCAIWLSNDDLKSIFMNVTIISIDEFSYDTSQDPRWSGARSHKLVLTSILAYIILLVALLVRRTVVGYYADEFVKFRSAIFYYLEPRLAFGKKRVRWICSKCGHRLYDDFQELQLGAIAKLQQDLYERYENTNKQANNGVSGSPSNSQDGKSRSSQRSFRQWWSAWRSSGGRSPTLPLHQVQDIPSQDPYIASAMCSAEKVFLLLCIPHRKWATKLVHMDLCTLLSDQLFFAELQNQYKSMQGGWRSWFTLKQLTRIQFVQFELHKNELVDIRKTNVLPPDTRKDYRYRPAPPEFIPPVGENLLMHLYEHPEDADDDAFCLDRIPKKLRERLVRPQQGSGVGWGVHFNEGLNLKKICMFGLLGLFLSALFGVVWSVKRDDIQGGFGVAAFVMAALTFTTGLVQATLEPN